MVRSFVTIPAIFLSISVTLADIMLGAWWTKGMKFADCVPWRWFSLCGLNFGFKACNLQGVFSRSKEYLWFTCSSIMAYS